ncbi:putative kinase protein [Exidia glandulosa HHB12029]|uniref:Putative kinase protein n=1 Tax=Exidia glandulosa HHB12029 TaxID=1314781 RepID=A0A166B8T2_EXIGL|nr:putative kinase protein [Exidia glandulosa HHB12029]
MHAYRRPTIATAVWRRAVQQPEPRRHVFAPFHRVYKPLVIILPFAGATAYLAYRATHKEPSAKLLLHSQSIIPPNAKVYAPLNLSPVEPRFSPLSRFLDFIRFRILEPLFTSGRFVHLCILFLPVIFSTPLLLLGPVDARSGERWGAVWWYGFLVKQMERAGPTFIKLAQWAGSRADLFPPLLCERFSALHSSGKVHSLAYTKRVIEGIFSRPFDEVFEEFDEIPIGSGAIAQVHRATLRANLLPPDYLNPKRNHDVDRRSLITISPPAPASVPSASVAIKVLHPRVTKTISRDLSIMTFFARALTLVPGVEWLSLPEEVEVFGEMMRGQLDLRNEVQNLIRFEQNFAKRQTPISFPRPLAQFSTYEVMVEEYIHALPLNYFLKNGGGPFDAMIAELGLDGFLNMLLLDNFVHSDAHPGNLLVKFYKPSTSYLLKGVAASIFNLEPPSDLSSTPDASATIDRLTSLAKEPDAWSAELDRLYEDGYRPEIVFLDAGLVTTLNDKNRKNFLDLFRAIAEFDGYRAGKLMVERCRTPELAIDSETFALKMQNLVLNVKSKTFSLSRIRIADVLTDVLKFVRQHHVKMEPDFVNTVISVLLLEGIGRQLDPTLDLFKSSLPILRQLGRQVSAKEALAQSADVGVFLKMWIWMEARELASTAIVNADDLVHADWLSPNI